MICMAALLMMALCCVSAEDKPINKIAKPLERIMCGRTLADTREYLCHGSVNIKREIPSQYLLDNVAGDSHEDNLPWVGRLGSLAATWTRVKRDGLADECCLKPCSDDVILRYC